MSDDTGEDTGAKRFLIAGLGASAGGLEALEQFFANVPKATGIAFVVVTHQLPGRASLMPELLAKRSAIPVTEVATAVKWRRTTSTWRRPGACSPS